MLGLMLFIQLAILTRTAKIKAVGDWCDIEDLPW